MLQRIESKPAEIFCRVVPELVSGVRVAHLMDGKCDDDDRNTYEKQHKIRLA